ncbi:MAG: hypothetical protein V4461_05575 [Pseudomonadota bacterium]
MPIDDLIGEAVGTVIGPAIGWVAEQTVDHVFSGYTLRFLHGIGRRVIAVATFGKKRIPSSLRLVPIGSKPKPKSNDWLALGVGGVVWVVFAGLALLTAATLL